MTTKAAFNAEDWTTVQEAPLLAGMRVLAAGRGGTLRETLAMGQVYAAARKRHAAGDLLDDLVSSPPAMDPSRFQSARDIEAMSAERLREAAAIMRATATPEELDAYRAFVVDVARAAAVAHREGGFLGFGGEEVSPDEQAALDAVEAALRE